jgi:flagellar protein FlbD
MPGMLMSQRIKSTADSANTASASAPLPASFTSLRSNPACRSERSTIFRITDDLIKYVEQSPDTVITLLNGEKILVRESAEEIIDRIILFRRRLLAGISPGGHAPAAALTAATAAVATADESEG